MTSVEPSGHQSDEPAVIGDDRQLGELLRRRYPPLRDSRAWDRFTVRLAEAERRRSTWPGAALGTAPLLLFVLVLVAGLQVWRASLGDAGPTPLRHVSPSRAEVGLLPFPAVEPEQLPIGLVKAERSTPAADRLELLYRNAAGTALLLAESPADVTAPPTVPASEFGQARVQVGDAAVLALNDPRPEAVAGALWDRRGVRFELLVIAAPPAGFSVADTARIVEALAAAQDSPAG